MCQLFICVEYMKIITHFYQFGKIDVCDHVIFQKKNCFKNDQNVFKGVTNLNVQNINIEVVLGDTSVFQW